MSDWLHSLPMLSMTLLVFGFTDYSPQQASWRVRDKVLARWLAEINVDAHMVRQIATDNASVMQMEAFPDSIGPRCCRASIGFEQDVKADDGFRFVRRTGHTIHGVP